MIDVQEGFDGKGIRLIEGDEGTFINEGGTISVAAGQVLNIEGLQDGDFNNGLETINVDLLTGQIDGTVRFTNTRTTLGTQSPLTGTAELIMRGTNNKIGDPNAQFTTNFISNGHTLNMLGENEFGSSIVELQAPLNIAGIRADAKH